ncbi:2-methoxy-6-polyprenyl-1,4-benzoquinol methylase [subsurface metagenome]
MLRKARAKGFGGNIEYLQADITEIPLGDEIFDSVVCYSSFPHFQDKLRALTEIHRVMKGGGSLLVCHTSSRRHINEIHSQIPVVENDVLPDGNEMQLLLSAAGFSEIKIADDSESYLASAERPL